MTNSISIKRAALGTCMAALLAAGMASAVATPALAQSQAVRATDDVTLSVGTGQLVTLDGTMSDVFVANEAIADVQVRSAEQIYIFGKGPGQTTVFATNRTGKVIYSADVRVGTNIASIGEMLALTMPNADITATPMNGMVVLTGTVAAPEDVAEADRLVQTFVGEGTQVISRLKTATPLQVMLKVQIAEVSRSLLRDIGVNLLTRDKSGGFLFGIGRGNPGTITDRVNPDIIDPRTGAPLVIGTDFTFNNNPNATTLGFAGSLLGLDVLSTLDLNENSGLVTMLAEPTLTALSGETASFLAGGEFPIATTSGLNGTQVEFKEYGVSLAFTPTVLDGGRISMRVRPEVSELTSEGSIRLNGIEIPGLSTRRAETTVELGSGQSFMIGGLLQNNGSNSVEKAPFLGDIPILGALFRSQGFRRNETELVIVITPYLVKPVNANQIALPTDGFRTSNDTQRVFVDQREDSHSGEQRPMPRVAAPQTVSPGIGGLGQSVPLPAPGQSAPPAVAASQAPAPAAKPGFSF
ncbi:type II and III secretion system protein family protein [Sphingosinicella humi]|uniref:Secretion system protein n=1 Tax=Allosphingosinicella humi TaxID=2068657 RepID=A0A2U2J4K8_9SPHN|nr:type II and III secretion system protein family protein [Sphingosinicella humi]PWG03283.1 secretion system protein [Sphingosinicella humi]